MHLIYPLKSDIRNYIWNKPMHRLSKVTEFPRERNCMLIAVRKSLKIFLRITLQLKKLVWFFYHGHYFDCMKPRSTRTNYYAIHLWSALNFKSFMVVQNSVNMIKIQLMQEQLLYFYWQLIICQAICKLKLNRCDFICLINLAICPW